MISSEPHLSGTEMKFADNSKPSWSLKMYGPKILQNSSEPPCRFSEHYIDEAKKIPCSQDQRVGNSRQPYALRIVLGRVLLGPMPKHTTKMEYMNHVHTETTLCSKIFGKFDLEFEEELSDHSELTLEDETAIKIVTGLGTVVGVPYRFQLPWERDLRDLPRNSEGDTL
ncbi:hypothetical protein FGIG_08991 [Fasciola gigantica]|uniref:Uncharacterized protein n=1 Tax=Fasciola gigantica TaxID=46835 RepID=A0A504YGP1_FASGI|nr:hypothetical protein FGIG_08991 [Fasciola gigantica]